jgi:hypothetical protein
MKWIKGSELSESDKRIVLAAYVHRFTGDHRPRWALRSNEKRVHFADDQDWLNNTLFAVTKSGKLDRRIRHCESRPTWPNNPELRK